MINKAYHIYIKTVAILFATVFFSCQDNYDNVKRLQKVSVAPVGIAENINLKHTDSGKVTLHLISDKMIDFSNKTFAYTTFPEGLKVHLYNNKKQQTTITADHAIIYANTDLFDLTGHVTITTHDSITLTAAQLYYDQKAEWIFTNQEYKYQTANGDYNIGKGGFDANKDFSIFSSLDNSSQQHLKN